MAFKVGETVVYPHHGAAKIIEITVRDFQGEKQKFLKLQVTQSNLEIMVPESKVEDVGVRDVIDKAGLKLVFGVLRDPIVEEPANWSRRYKANLEKLASGDVIKVVSRQGKSACSPRLVKFSFPNLPSPKRRTRNAPQFVSTRFSPPNDPCRRSDSFSLRPAPACDSVAVSRRPLSNSTEFRCWHDRSTLPVS